MWSGPSVLITSIFFWSYVTAEFCTTPLGRTSNCVLINDCPALAVAFDQKFIPKSVVDFLFKSQCGSEGRTPKICCGPLPQEELDPRYYIQVPPEIPRVDSVGNFAEDSLPAPKNQCGIDINENSIDDHSELNKIPSKASKKDGNQDCTTPSGRRSKCVSVYECPDVFSAINLVTLPDDTISYIQQFKCGFEGSVPKVCCQSLPLKKAITKFKEIATPRPTVLEPRIYNGRLTEPLEFPWMALLVYKNNSGVMSCQCGGSLINHRYILTAAHCLTGKIMYKFGTLVSVRLGEYDIRHNIDCLGNTCADPPQEIPVDSIYPHPGFIDGERSRRHDIGIVRLAKRATYNNYVQPICLGEMNAKIDVGDQMFIAGWGKILNGSRSNIKLKLQLPMVNKKSCAKKYRNLKNTIELDENQLCAGGVFAEDACIGDSGGPLMKKSPEGVWEAFGVISTGLGCGADGWPGLYSSVVGYLDWIKSTIRSSNL